MATDGLWWIFIKYDRDTYTHDTIAEVDLQPVVLAAFENLVGPNEATEVWLDDELRSVVEEFIRVFEFENFLSIASDAPTVIKERKQAITDEFYDEYVQRVFGIGDGEDEPRSRSLIGEGIVAPSEATGDDIRLFAVELMNRLIFVKFLEDKELVDSGLLRSLQTAHSQGMHPDSFYKTFLEPLFFGVLDERPSERPERVRGITLYENIPYLNGGLFRPVETGESGIDDTDFDVRDSVLGSIINLLERYTFSADGGPTDLDPSILGNVFEKTINHITGDAGDQKKELAVLGTYSPALGTWPAVVGFVSLIGIIENLTVIPRSPHLTSLIITVFTFVMIGGAILYGTAWFHRVDPLSVLYRLFGRVATIKLSRTANGGYDLEVWPPWQGCLDPVESVPLVVFIIATAYTVSFDGFTSTRLFQTILFGVRDALGTGPGTSMLLYAVGLGSFVCTFGLGSWLTERLGATTARDWLAAARWFAPTVLPIAAAYEVAHNYPYVIRNLGQLLVIVMRPILPGIEPFEPLGWLSLPVFWGSQAVLIVLGHVIAVVAAHYVAVDRYDSVAAARRGHLPLVVLMVGYTVLSLWIISQPVISR